MNKSKFNAKRLSATNITDYLIEYFGGRPRNIEHHLINNFQPLLQKDYGLDSDCTLTSLTSCLCYYLPDMNPLQVYPMVEDSANKYFYNGNSYGTPNTMIKAIYDDVNNKLNRNVKTKWKCIKNVGFNFNTIKDNIDNNIPVILSMQSDGRDYYKKHSVTVVGYNVYAYGNKCKEMLTIYDNWYKSFSYIDYSKISILSSINY